MRPTRLLLALAALGLLIPACDSRPPSAPPKVEVQAEVSATGLVIFYRDTSEPSDKYERINYELTRNKVFVQSGSIGNHQQIGIPVSLIGEYQFASTAVSASGDDRGFNVFPITVTGL